MSVRNGYLTGSLKNAAEWDLRIPRVYYPNQKWEIHAAYILHCYWTMGIFSFFVCLFVYLFNFLVQQSNKQLFPNMCVTTLAQFRPTHVLHPLLRFPDVSQVALVLKSARNMKSWCVCACAWLKIRQGVKVIWTYLVNGRDFIPSHLCQGSFLSDKFQGALKRKRITQREKHWRVLSLISCFPLTTLR